MIVVSTLSAAAITEMAVRTGRRAFLDGASLALGLLTAAHFATVLAFPGGMYATAAYRENYLLGYDNAALTTLLPAVCLAALRDCERGRRLSVRTDQPPHHWQGQQKKSCIHRSVPYLCT